MITAKDLTSYCKSEKDLQLAEYFSGSERTQVEVFIKQMNLSPQQNEKLKEVIDTVLTETYYTLLLALDGSATIGGLQHTFKIYDEDNNLVSDCGELEAEAYEQFHESQQK